MAIKIAKHELFFIRNAQKFTIKYSYSIFEGYMSHTNCKYVTYEIIHYENRLEKFYHID